MVIWTAWDELATPGQPRRKTVSIQLYLDKGVSSRLLADLRKISSVPSNGISPMASLPDGNIALMVHDWLVKQFEFRLSLTEQIQYLCHWIWSEGWLTDDRFNHSPIVTGRSFSLFGRYYAFTVRHVMIKYRSEIFRV